MKGQSACAHSLGSSQGSDLFRPEEYLVGPGSLRKRLFQRLLSLELRRRQLRGEVPAIDACRKRFPQFQSVADSVYQSVCGRIDGESDVDVDAPTSIHVAQGLESTAVTMVPFPERIESTCEAFEEQWAEGTAPQIEEYLSQVLSDEQGGLLKEPPDRREYFFGFRVARTAAEAPDRALEKSD